MALNVIALISGGKDSFFSLLHCMAHGHRVVALANLHPEAAAEQDGADEEDLNSFMYQTVGHQVLPLYAAATGLPLYRQPIVGHAVQSGREYHHDDDEGDETESMTRLLRRVLADHPEANAICAGALLSTYQRTRVESVAVRLGLVSLAYLWKYPILPAAASSSTVDYLDDLTAAGFDARIIKVASGGLDESLLWTNVASAIGRARLQRALQRLGLADDGPCSMLGEGGEYETLVVDGPRALFREGSLSVADTDRRVVHESGGTAWLQIRTATVVPEDKVEGLDGKDNQVEVRQPRLLDARFAAVLALLRAEVGTDVTQSLAASLSLADETPFTLYTVRPPVATTWRVLPDLPATSPSPSIADATQSIVDQVRHRLQTLSPTHSVVRTLVVLRHMADFPAFNAVYGTLFTGAPNPPSRVTIACGEELPAGVEVAVFLSVLDDTEKIGSASRQGLHVQSRSYWAPANIGPYSQAVSVLAHGNGDNNSNGPRIVSIAGQIPLVPSSMDLPDQTVEAREGETREQAETLSLSSSSSSAPASFSFQATLALQHLWRIGIDLDVQWWGSAVAYVPRQADEHVTPSSSNKALMIAQAWRTAHEWRPNGEDDEEEDDDDETNDGPDLWDRKFDTRYAMYGGSGGGSDENTPQLPDWRVLQGGATGTTEKAIPPVFLAEVQKLPRSAPVEWHAQAGFSHVLAGGNSSIQVRAWSGTDSAPNKTWTHQTILKTAPPRDDNDDGDDSDSENDTKDSRPAATPRRSRVVVQTTTAWAYPEETGSTKMILPDASLSGNVDVVYADMHACQIPESRTIATPVVPCASLWNGRGERLAAVVVRTVYGEA